MDRATDIVVRYPSDAWCPRESAPAFDARRHDPEMLAGVAHQFSMLLGTERASVAMAARAASDLAILGAPPELLGVAGRVIEDEVRHVGVCEHVLRAMGRDVHAECAWKPPASASSPGARGDALARLLVVGFVVGETLSEASFACVLAHAGEPLVRWALTELLRDESRHWAFGADAAAWILRDASSADRRAIWPECVAMIEGVESRLGGPVGRELLAREARRSDWEQRAHYGLLRASVACGAIVDAIPRWLVPRLAPLGVPEGDGT